MRQSQAFDGRSVTVGCPDPNPPWADHRQQGAKFRLDVIESSIGQAIAPATELRMTNSGSTSCLHGGSLPPLTREIKASAASLPTWRGNSSTVDNAGNSAEACGTLSKPMIEKSRPIVMPAPCTAAYAPKAVISLKHIAARHSGCRASKSSMAVSPPWRLGGPSTIQSSEIEPPETANASRMPLRRKLNVGVWL